MNENKTNAKNKDKVDCMLNDGAVLSDGMVLKRKTQGSK